jgi:hypothetical protein
MPLTVWAALPRAAVVPLGCEKQDVTGTYPVALTGNINCIKPTNNKYNILTSGNSLA